MSIKKKEKKKWYKNIKNEMKIKNKVVSMKEKVSTFLELPKEVIQNSTKITIIEDENILIEGYKKIVDYYDNYIKIKANNMYVVIDGTNLDIEEITDFELVISGKIYSINYKK
ncbi:sporulation protein YqfC [Clostridium sp. CAG:921]|nr:sporulation protein YqfC [Clostridium sp. CAG:921]